ncbi:MAG: DUF4397 domain-containing protein [Anaerolineales bacterium]|nr:DUF4397 domain-containing protein [Anaerolineales bacterium]
MKTKIWLFIIPLFVLGLLIALANTARATAPQQATIVGAPARVHVAHFAPFASELDDTSVTVRVNGADALTDFVFGETTGYLDFAEGEYLIEILPTGTNTVAISGTVTLVADTDYTLAAIGNGSLQPLELFALVDDNAAPTAGSAKIRIAHLAPFAADLSATQVDICTDDGTPVLTNVPYKVYTAPYVQLPAGDYDLKIAAPGTTCGTTYLDIPEVRLADGDVIDVFAIGDIANQPLQVTSLTGITFTSARVNVAHFAPFASELDDTSVTVRVDGADALIDFVFGESTGYPDFLSGSHFIEILPTGTNTVAISGTVTLDKDTDYTLAAIGNGVLQPLELFALVDDNSTPDPGNFSLRVAHLAPFAADLNATEVDICTDDGTVLLNDVPYKGYTDPYVQLPAGDYSLQIAAPDDTCSLVVLEIPEVRFEDGEVADVFAIGDLAFQPLQVTSLTGLTFTQARVNVAHFAPFASELDGTSVTVRVNGLDALTDFVFGESTGYLDFAPGPYLIEILPTGSNVVAISGNVTLAKDVDYTLAAIGNGSLQPLELFALVDDATSPSAGNAKIRIAHLAPFASDLSGTNVDICTDDGTAILTNVPYKGYTNPYVELPAGDYDLQIAAPGGTCETTLLDIPSVRLSDGDIADVFAIGDLSNQPLQVTSLTGLTFTPASVNVAHFAPFASEALEALTSTSVTVRVNGADALTDFIFGAQTGYLELGPGSVFVEILPTGTNTVVLSGTFELDAAAYYTLAAIGDGTNQPLELFALADDPTLPGPGNSRVRIVHLAPFAAALVDTEVDLCTEDGTAILTNVPYKGFTDPYLELPAGLYDLKITAAGSSCGTTLIDVATIALREGQVATVFALGDGGNAAPTVTTDIDLAPNTMFLPLISR